MIQLTLHHRRCAPKYVLALRVRRLRSLGTVAEPAPEPEAKEQKREREKPHCGETTQHAPTPNACNQPAVV